jgi:hypothetical protein
MAPTTPPSRQPGADVPPILVAASFQLAYQRPRASKDACRYKKTNCGDGRTARSSSTHPTKEARQCSEQ